MHREFSYVGTVMKAWAAAKKRSPINREPALFEGLKIVQNKEL